MEKKDIVLVTGQSGINIKNCLKKIINDIPDLGVFSIDHEIEKILGQDFIDILGYPPKVLQEYWDIAFKRIDNDISNSKNENTIVSFHASYYHQQKRQFISAVNFKKIYQWKQSRRIKSIIVLIDDCYDIYMRLTSNGKMFNYINVLKPKEAIFHSVSNLILILMWREIELAFSQKIAQLLDIPIFVFAVKHSISLFNRLIEKRIEDLNILYLSHPISSVRVAKESLNQDFNDELNEFIKMVLKNNPNLILFIPDTIDEKRIIVEHEDSKRIFIPKLNSRWRLPFKSDQMLFDPLPSDDSDDKEKPLNPHKYKNQDDKDSISQTLSILNEKIGDQVNSRDISLIEQSKNGIIIYRPCWEGFVASGVSIEVEYNCLLRKLNKIMGKGRKNLIIGTEDDIGKLRIRKLFSQISYDIENCNINELHRICNLWIEDPKKVLEFSSMHYNWAEIRKEIENFCPIDYTLYADEVGTLGPGRGLGKRNVNKKYWENLKEIIENTSIDYLEFDSIFDRKLVLSHSDESKYLINKKALEFVNKNLV